MYAEKWHYVMTSLWQNNDVTSRLCGWVQIHPITSLNVTLWKRQQVSISVLPGYQYCQITVCQGPLDSTPCLVHGLRPKLHLMYKYWLKLKQGLKCQLDFSSFFFHLWEKLEIIWYYRFMETNIECLSATVWSLTKVQTPTEQTKKRLTGFGDEICVFDDTERSNGVKLV